MNGKPGVLAVMDEARARLHQAHDAARGKNREVFAEAHGNLMEARATVERLAKAANEHLRRHSASSEESLMGALAAFRGEA